MKLEVFKHSVSILCAKNSKLNVSTKVRNFSYAYLAEWVECDARI